MDCLVRLVNSLGLLTELKTCVIRVTKAILCKLHLFFLVSRLTDIFVLFYPRVVLQTLDDFTIILAIVLTSWAGDDGYFTT